MFLTTKFGMAVRPGFSGKQNNMVSESRFQVLLKSWETEFFGMRWGLLKSNVASLTLAVSEDPKGIAQDLERILASADEQYDLVEFNCIQSDFLVVALLEEYGFRMVDTRITFKTLFNASQVKQQENFKLDFPDLEIKDYAPAHMDGIIALTDKHLTGNPSFISRFKNTQFIRQGDCERYFRTWIRNSLQSPDAVSAVLTSKNGTVEGYFIYEKKGDEDGKPVYKGILTVVNDRYRGKSTHLALQAYLFSRIKEETYYIDNTTQLTNIPVIKNHIKSHRLLDHIAFTFYRKNRFGKMA